MADLINRTNMYEIQEYWLDNIAPKYFDMADTSLNRASLFGYINEIESHSMEALVNENSILYNELFFKRAQLPETIYAYAAQNDVANTTATASMMKFAIVINEQLILDKAIKDASNEYFIIDSNSEIIVEDEIYFSLDYDIKINIRKRKDGKYSYVARYMTTDLGNPISAINSTSNPYIELAKIRYNNLSYVILYVVAHQTVKTVKNKIIYSDNFIDFFNFNVESGSNLQIADFSVYYREPRSDKFTQIEKILIDKEATDDKFCYFQFKDNNLNNSVNISFSTIPRYFQPEFNSELKFVFYNTLGASGSFEYTGDNVKINLKSDVYDYTDAVMNIIPIGDSVGGADAYTYDEINNQVSIMASTADVLATEIDLNKYFQNLKMQSNILFVKKEDDVKRRLFGAFTMFKDSMENIIPSNTLDIDLYDSDFDLIEESTKRYVMKAGSKFIYQPNSRRLSKIGDLSSLLFEPRFIYMNPFTIIINRSEFFTTYYLTSIDKNYIPHYSIINEDLYLNFIMNNVNIYRNSLKSDTYEITFSITPATDSTDVLFANIDNTTGEFISDNNELKIKGMIYSDDNVLTHYFNCEMIGCVKSDSTSTDVLADGTNDTSIQQNSNVTYYFKTTIKTDDYISIYSNLRTTDGVFDVNDPTKINPLIPATGLNIKFGIFLKDTVNPIHMDDVYHKYIPGLDLYNMTNVFTLAEDVPFITDMNRLMYSTALYQYTEDNDLYYRVKEVPMIKSEYLDIDKFAMSFYKSFLSDYLVFKDTLVKVNNAFDISIKLFNTYGKSYYLYVNDKKSNTLDKVNLSISYRIQVNPNKLADDILKDDIKTSIREYIESVNSIDDLDFYISNQITLLETTYTDIISTEFRYMNEYSSEVQSIRKNFPTDNYEDKGLISDFVPEYLNISKTFKDSNTVIEDVIVEFV